MLSIIEIIANKLRKSFVEAGYEEKYGNVSVSNRPDLCQFQCNGALAAAKQYKKAPIMIANEICSKLEGDEFFEKIEAVMPGFLNITLSDAAIETYLQDMVVSPKFGFEPKNNGKTAIVDYGGANVAKPLHVGHLRTAIIGESCKRILSYDGYKAIGDVHLGDWGLQIGLIITEVKKRNPDLVYFDDTYTGEYPSEPPFTISDLEEIYPFASAYSKEEGHEAYKEEAKQATVLLQNGKRGYVALWKHILDVSIKDLKRNYDNLNVHFELWKKESDANPYIADMIEDMKKMGITEMSEGALVVNVKEETDSKEMPPCILLKSDGGALYASTDLATLIEREKLYKPDEVLYVVDKRQGLHFEQVFRTARKAKIVRNDTRLDFLGFGTMNGKDGKPFKTRDGGVYRLEYLIKDISDEVYNKMQNREMSEEDIKSISKKVGLAALKYGDLSNQASKDYIFDVERFASFEGNTGPYICYTMVRIKSILDKYAGTVNSTSEELIKSVLNNELKISTTAFDRTESERKLMLGILGFTDMIRNASDEFAPHKICSYVYELSNLFNSFYHENKIIAEENEDIKKHWIATIILVLRILEDCMDLLEIDVPYRM